MGKASLPLSLAGFLTLALIADFASAVIRYQKVLPLLPSVWIAAAALGCSVWTWISARREGARRWLRASAVLLGIIDLVFLVGYAALETLLSRGPHPYK